MSVFSNNLFFSFLSFFKATDIFWTVTEQNNKPFFLYAANSRKKRNWTLRNQQEKTILKGYNMINGVKL
jgi:hypothetical protein